MHEASLALSILEIARENCRNAGFGRINSIRLRIGKASGVMTDALLFAFDAAKGKTEADGATLVIEEVPVGGTCRACGEEFTTDEKYVFACPFCGSSDFAINTGRELDVIDLEVDD